MSINGTHNHLTPVCSYFTLPCDYWLVLNRRCWQFGRSKPMVFVLHTFVSFLDGFTASHKMNFPSFPTRRMKPRDSSAIRRLLMAFGDTIISSSKGRTTGGSNSRSRWRVDQRVGSSSCSPVPLQQAHLIRGGSMSFTPSNSGNPPFRICRECGRCNSRAGYGAYPCKLGIPRRLASLGLCALSSRAQ